MVTALCLTRLEFLDAAREDDRLTRVLDNTDQMMAVTKQMMAILPAILLVSNPFQSASGPSNLEAKQKAFDFKLKLLVYYFNRRQTTNHPCTTRAMHRHCRCVVAWEQLARTLTETCQARWSKSDHAAQLSASPKCNGPQDQAVWEPALATAPAPKWKPRETCTTPRGVAGRCDGLTRGDAHDILAVDMLLPLASS